MQVLVVEDSPHVRDAFSLLLEFEGAVVRATESGCAAIEMAGQGPVDVVLADLELPDIPGDSVIRQVLDRASPRPRIVVVTGLDERVAKRAEQAGADAVLLKPIMWERLLVHLRPGDRDIVAA